ncbi:UbiA family prenyltransferase [Leptolyngbya sp. BC1307]|uniref:UbiA family prenyltransferase n=1 Tax=Leptolyngbya sp. BC1307 TaxID=2029589 RepID=UPI000EFCF5C0|nr:UbiA family prenyltransferase [Leptolyngbya sp. BC1307]
MLFQTVYSQLLANRSNELYRRLLQIFVYPSIWVAGAIASLTFFVQDTLALPPDWRPAALIFCAALLPYNLDRVLDTFIQKIPDSKTQAFFQRPAVLLILLGAAVSTGTLIYQAPPSVRWVSLGGLVPLIYGLPLFPWRSAAGTVRWYRLKDIPGTKAWLVCGSITYAVVGLPLGYAMQRPDLSVIMTALWLLIFIGSNSHMFDVRDVESDRQQGVSTLPLLAGVGGTRVILTVLNGLSSVLLAWGWARDLQVPGLAIALPATLLTLIYVWTLTPKTPRQVYNIWIDGILFLPALLMLGFR